MRFHHYMFVVLLLTAACTRSAESPSPTTPGPPAPQPPDNLQGLWTGTLTDGGVESSATTYLTRNYNSLTGAITLDGSISWTGSAGSATGTFRGIVNGPTLSFRIVVPVGGFTSPPSNKFCAATLVGTAADITGSQISGEYSGTNTCRGLVPFPGVLRITK